MKDLWNKIKQWLSWLWIKLNGKKTLLGLALITVGIIIDYPELIDSGLFYIGVPVFLIGIIHKLIKLIKLIILRRTESWRMK